MLKLTIDAGLSHLYRLDKSPLLQAIHNEAEFKTLLSGFASKIKTQHQKVMQLDQENQGN